MIGVDGPLRRTGLGHHHRGAPRRRHHRTGAGPAAAGRPLARFDDDFDLFPTARRAFPERRSDPTGLIAVDPATGLTAEHSTTAERALRRWRGS